MPNKTTNYQLNQFLPEDDFLRADFNEDNAKLEAALTGLQAGLDTLESETDAALEELESSLTNSINSAKTTLNSAISTLRSDTEADLSALETTLNATIESTKTTLNNTITSTKNSLTSTINSNKTSLTNSINAVAADVTAAEKDIAALETALANAKPVFGSYTGAYPTSTSTTTAFHLGFKPSMVFVMAANGSVTDSNGSYCGMAFAGSTGNAITITSTGFTVANSNFSYLNKENKKYHYVALR